jgi:multidrug efflux pump subunit AcrA (membrane-fusion protein)
VQNNLAAIATVETAKAQIKTYEAAVETARINLDFTRLVAPIDGIAGQAQLQVGALVTPSSGVVTSVSTVNPIKVYFTVGEPQYLDDHSKARCSTPPNTSTAAMLENLREAVRAAIFVARLTLVDKIFPATPGRRAGLRARLP